MPREKKRKEKRKTKTRPKKKITFFGFFLFVCLFVCLFVFLLQPSNRAKKKSIVWDSHTKIEKEFWLPASPLKKDKKNLFIFETYILLKHHFFFFFFLSVGLDALSF